MSKHNFNVFSQCKLKYNSQCKISKKEKKPFKSIQHRFSCIGSESADTKPQISRLVSEGKKVDRCIYNHVFVNRFKFCTFFVSRILRHNWENLCLVLKSSIEPVRNNQINILWQGQRKIFTLLSSSPEDEAVASLPSLPAVSRRLGPSVWQELDRSTTCIIWSGSDSNCPKLASDPEWISMEPPCSLTEQKHSV